MGKSIDFRDRGIRNGINFRNFGTRNGIEFCDLLFCYFKRDWYNFAFSLDSISKKGSDAQASLCICFQKKNVQARLYFFKKIDINKGIISVYLDTLLRQSKTFLLPFHLSFHLRLINTGSWQSLDNERVLSFKAIEKSSKIHPCSLDIFFCLISCCRC